MAVAPENLDLAKYRQEWWKIGISALTPIVLAFLTFFITQILDERQPYLRRGEQILSEKQKIYPNIGDYLNVIYVYVADVGDFRRFTPRQIVETKRQVDRLFHMYSPYWSRRTKDAYSRFMNAAFTMHVAIGTDAGINSPTSEKKAAFAADDKNWDPTWDGLFTGSRHPELGRRYYTLVSSFMEDIASFSLDTGQQSYADDIR